MKRFFLLLCSLAACHTPRESLQPTLEGIVARYAEDPAGAVAELVALPDPRDRMLAVEALTLHHGLRMLEQGGCDELQEEPLRKRCAEILERAHLFSDRQAAPTVEPEDRPSLTCDQHSSPSWCARAAARAAVQAREPEPWKHCDGVPTPTLRHECAFELGEAIIRQKGVGGYALAVGACRQAGPFETNCLDHISAELARRAVADLDGACVGEAGFAGTFSSSIIVVGGTWTGRDNDARMGIYSTLDESLYREILVAVGTAPEVEAAGPPPYERRLLRLARFATGGLGTDYPSTGPGADPPRAHAARLAGLSHVAISLGADAILVQQVQDPRALDDLRRAMACVGGPAHPYPYMQLSPPEHRAGVLSRYPLSVLPDGVGVQTSERSPRELTLAWGSPDEPLSWQSEAWSPAPGSPPEPVAVSLPFMVDPQGQPLPWNPSAKRGYSDQLPELMVLVRAAESPR